VPAEVAQPIGQVAARHRQCRTDFRFASGLLGQFGFDPLVHLQCEIAQRQGMFGQFLGKRHDHIEINRLFNQLLKPNNSTVTGISLGVVLRSADEYRGDPTACAPPCTAYNLGLQLGKAIVLLHSLQQECLADQVRLYCIDLVPFGRWQRFA
jgi:hypothetical protein